MSETVVPGGKAPVRNADQDSQEVADSVRGDVEAKVGKKYDQFQVACYRTQVVAGINYYIKVKVSDGCYIHITIWKKLGDAGNELTGVEENKTLDDPL